MSVVIISLLDYQAFVGGTEFPRASLKLMAEGQPGGGDDFVGSQLGDGLWR